MKVSIAAALTAGLALSLLSFGAGAANMSVPPASGTTPLAPYLIPIADSACTIKCEKQAQQCRGSCGPQVTCKQGCNSSAQTCKAACK
ncbi:MAG: hypothetical protein VX871_10100 [Pseudomonadota bacterium]|nr:hypothetical protein [Pseudomonadota bacterium]